jgi:hypothetical protein
MNSPQELAGNIDFQWEEYVVPVSCRCGSRMHMDVFLRACVIYKNSIMKNAEELVNDNHSKSWRKNEKTFFRAPQPKGPTLW